METLEMEQEAFVPPQINSWAQPPSREQVQYARDLCTSELPYAERVRTIATFPTLDSGALSDLITELAEVRRKRMARLRGRRRGRRGVASKR